MRARRVREGDVVLARLGGPTVLVEVHGWRFLTDPTFDPPGRRYAFGWGTGSRKRSGPALDPDEVGPVDAVLLSHDHHADNLDDLGRASLERAQLVVTTRPGARRLRRAGTGPVVGLAPGERVLLRAPGRPPVRVSATPCRHGPRFSRPLAGAVVGFALSWDTQRHGVLWITGDTVLHPALERVARDLVVDTLVLHAGAVRFPVTGPLRWTMDAAEAVRLCALARPRAVVPVHVEGWSHFTEGRDALDRAFAAAPGDLAARLR
ncbi:MBL fold metallo-hydrolase [Kineococcus terrestris]|uniref:MBL fold metallo-hydrolase n=1 Tax=Kineococcus terrestris TaxID=2044856 RepID=UPI0034DAC8F1